MLVAAGFATMQQLAPRIFTKKRNKTMMNVHQKAAMKKSNKMQNIMILVSAGMAVIFSAGMQVY